MRERLITFAGALLALVVATLLLVPPRRSQEPSVSLPTSADQGAHGLAGLHAWMADGGLPVVSLRDRYASVVQDPGIPLTGNLMLTVAPHRMPSRHLERQKLYEWVSAGNAVLVLYALADSPSWLPPFRPVGSRAEEDEFIRELGFRPHGHRETDADQAEEEPDTGPPVREGSPEDRRDREVRTLVPAGPHPVLERVERVVGEKPVNRPHAWHLDGEQGMRSCVVLLEDEVSAEPAFWHCRVGTGDLFVSVYADLFGNAGIASADNAVLVANLVNYSLEESGQVIFDDMHQGLTNLYDPAAFFNDPRLHRTLGFIGTFWVIYLIGHTSPLGRRAVPRELAGAADFTRITGNFLARRLHTAAAARRVLVHFFNEVRMAYGLPLNGLPVWDTLSRNARVDPGLLEELRRMNNRAKTQKPVNLVRLVNHISRIRKGLI